MAEREKNIHIQPSSSISRTHIFPALLAIAAVSGLCAFVSPPLGPWRVILSNPGMYIDLLALLFLLFMLWSSTKVRMNHVAVRAAAMDCRRHVRSDGRNLPPAALDGILL